jgi:hypothetical protein
MSEVARTQKSWTIKLMLLQCKNQVTQFFLKLKAAGMVQNIMGIG